jgi:large subunit ribosomal protein L10
LCCLAAADPDFVADRARGAPAEGIVLRAEKTDLVASLRDTFVGSGVVVVTHYKGLNVAEVSGLRRQMRDAGAGFRVAKNRLVKLAIDGTDFASTAALFSGPTAIGYSADPTVAPKVLTDFARKNDKLKIVGAGLGGTLLDAEAVKALAEMPSIDELRAKLLGVLNAPASKLLGLLEATPTKLVRVLSAPNQNFVGVLRAKSQVE